MNSIRKDIKTIKNFIKNRNYTYSLEEILETYEKYFLNDSYMSYSFNDCMKNCGQEIKRFYDYKQELLNHYKLN